MKLLGLYALISLVTQTGLIVGETYPNRYVGAPEFSVTDCHMNNLTDRDCKSGWFGPCCQYRDLAFSALTDNNKTTCLEVIRNNVTVPLGQAQHFAWMRWYAEDATKLHNISVHFKGNKSEVIECGKQLMSNNYMDIYCAVKSPVKEVILKGEGVSSLCSVHISGGRSVNVSKPTGDIAMERTFEIESKNGPSYSYNFTSVQLYGYKVFINNKSNETIEVTVSAGTESHNTSINTDSNHSNFLTTNKTEIVEVEFQKGHKNFKKIEFFVESGCDSGKYGFLCDATCICEKNESCFAWSGLCRSGCPAGQFGVNCSKACKEGTCGVGCKSRCRTDCIDQSCNRTDCSCGTRRLTTTTTTTTTESTIMLKTSPKASPSNDDDDGAKHFAIAAITLACCCAIVAGTVCLIVFVWRRRKRTKQENNDESMSMLELSKNATLPVRSSQYNDLWEGPGRHHTTMSVYDEIIPTRISVQELGSFLASKNREFFEAQFKKIPTCLSASVSVGQKRENINKNRYKNIAAYDHSRVHLQINPSKDHGDYINASYVRGYRNAEQFIAAQGPTASTVKDFVRMIWEQRSEKVVMLANLVEEGRNKSERYWPEGEEEDFGDIRVILIAQEHFPDYTIRRLKLAKLGYPSQKVTHYHFTSWPDKDVPRSPWGLVDFEQRVAAVPTIKPIVVHCSAGVGRTGTFIALCNAICEAQDTGKIDFYSNVLKLRQDRILLVQTLDQYIFVHKAAHVALLCMGTTIASNDIPERVKKLEQKVDSKKTKMDQEFEVVCKVSAHSHLSCHGEEMSDLSSKHKKGVISNGKNRHQEIVPENQHRPYLIGERNNEDVYINAVLVPSFTRRDQNIITQLPLPNTITEFWKLVIQYSVSLIVAFETNSMDTDWTMGDYLQNYKENTHSSPQIRIKLGTSRNGSLCEKRKVIIQQNMKQQQLRLGQAQIVKHQVVHMKCQLENYDPQKLLAIVKQIRSANSDKDERILYMCKNGACYSGLVCVLSLLLDRLERDLCLTVPLTVGAIKAIRPQVIPTVDQYRLLYKAMQSKQSDKHVRWKLEDLQSTSDLLNCSENLSQEDCLLSGEQESQDEVEAENVYQEAEDENGNFCTENKT